MINPVGRPSVAAGEPTKYRRVGGSVARGQLWFGLLFGLNMRMAEFATNDGDQFENDAKASFRSNRVFIAWG